eukprot:TRINITY_DN6320_c0_g1_i1.p1 TRINITY_DN6320_c0_g1~~TRINITY_DN6320_c0_g1_i1.p1  ORF type:complete len:267 (-),score=19.30 TRINITY_DN6320_c0_g1_i1:103-903(-)
MSTLKFVDLEVQLELIGIETIREQEPQLCKIISGKEEKVINLHFIRRVEIVNFQSEIEQPIYFRICQGIRRLKEEIVTFPSYLSESVQKQAQINWTSLGGHNGSIKVTVKFTRKNQDQKLTYQQASEFAPKTEQTQSKLPAGVGRTQESAMSKGSRERDPRNQVRPVEPQYSRQGLGPNMIQKFEGLAGKNSEIESLRRQLEESQKQVESREKELESVFPNIYRLQLENARLTSENSMLRKQLEEKKRSYSSSFDSDILASSDSDI